MAGGGLHSSVFLVMVSGQIESARVRSNLLFTKGYLGLLKTVSFYSFAAFSFPNLTIYTASTVLFMVKIGSLRL